MITVYSPTLPVEAASITTLQTMKPQLSNMSQLQNREKKIKKRQQQNFNR